MTFAQLLNQNSYTLAALFVLALILLIALWRVREKKIALAVVLVAAAMLAVINWVLRDGAGEIETLTQFDEIRATSQPLVLEIYSNY